MKILLSLAHLFVVLMLSVPSSQQLCDGFEDFVKKYSKQYSSQQEKQYRHKVFCQNVQKIEQMNAKNHGYKLKINKFADRTQLQMVTNNGLSEIRIPQQQLQTSAVQVKENPSSLDWRSSNIVTSIKDQGSCGACWAFATCAYAESKLVKNGQFDLSLDLSEQFLLQCTNHSSCSGGYMEYAMKLAEQQGIPREVTYPYNPSQTTSGICDYNGVDPGDQHENLYNLTDDQIMTLLQEGPLAITIASSGWSGYDSGIFKCSSGVSIDHAVLLVGYSEDYWIVKNQWNQDWGEQGYIRITRDRQSSQNCLIGRAVYKMWAGTLNYVFILLLVLLGFLI